MTVPPPPGHRPNAATGARYWIGVASRDHVLRGVEGGFTMLNHGKLGPLLRLQPGDGFVAYSPRGTYPDGPALKAFTAIGTIRDAPPYQAPMQPGKTGFRRDIDWREATETPIASLTDRLDFTRGNWGMLARLGVFEITKADFATIRDAMCAQHHKEE